MSKKHFLVSMLFSVGVLMGCNVSADNVKNTKSTNAAPSTMDKQELKIKAELESKVKDIQIKSVKKTNVAELYEVVLSNNDILYTDANARYSLIGHLIDNSNMNDITQARLDTLSTVDFKSLPLSQSFKLVKGEGKRSIVLFEDPNCGYCKVFRHTLESMDNISVHTFALDILGDDSTARAKVLLCAADPAHAWDEWMLHNKMPNNSGECDTSVLQKNKALAESLNISGTPTIIFENGQRIPGAASKETVEGILNSIKSH